MLTGHSLTDAAILYALMAQLFCMNFHEMLKLLRRVGVNEEKVKKCVNNILQQFGIKHRDLVELCKTRLKSIVEEYECYKIDVDSVYNYVKKFFTKNSVIFATITKALCPNLSDDDLYFLFLVDTTGKKIAKVVEDVKKMFVKCK